MEYNFIEIEAKWQNYWSENKTFKANNVSDKPKYYVLDMFPYPSGSGLHVGHPLGYIASDIYSRYMRLKGYNVLHPIGFDAYGLPAEQYAIQTGQHPAKTTEINTARYKEQMNKIGFSFDWDREVSTSDPAYYKWTQWTFIKLFNSWFNVDLQKAQSIDDLISLFKEKGNDSVNAASSEISLFTAEEWNNFTEEKQQEMLMHYRLAYLANSEVNWCPALGTVLANDEVKDGVSERGGHPVIKKTMKQWLLRISAYSQRLLDGLETLDWSDSIKEVQKNWIGRSEGAQVFFNIDGHDEQIEVFTTRPDTLYGATFMVLAPEHDLVKKITTSKLKEPVEQYVVWAKNRSERERMTDVKKITGVFTGCYGINPLNGEKIPIWIADYVLSGYGTGAIMAVPAHDSRDFAFARHFELPIIQVILQKGDQPNDPLNWDDSYDSKEGILINSELINGLDVKEAISTTIAYLEENKIGSGNINYRLRDAIFSRQRYWGEPFPVYYKNGLPYTLTEDQLPIELPSVDDYKPDESGQSPLARAHDWTSPEGYPMETNTMPGFAGSSGYYLRYMDSKNENEYFSKESNEYWQNVDLYIGGDEHATGHLIYARFWNKFLFDLGLVCKDEPFQKLLNQGKITGRSSFAYRINGTNKFVSYNLKDQYETTALHADINFVENDILDIEAFKNWMPDYNSAEFILEDGKYICGWEIEKMSKSKYNVQNPDDLIERYGADTLRMYEMFLGPIEQHKPWDTKGIEGVYRFLKKFWRLFYDQDGQLKIEDKKPTAQELKVLHQTIKKIKDDIERFSFNTAVSTFMICTSELQTLDCNNKQIFSDLLILIAPFAPHIAEELWLAIGNNEGISYNSFPEFKEEYVKENNFEYPVSFNGKTRFKLSLAIDLSKEEIEKAVMESAEATKWLDGKTVRKVIVVPKRIINFVVS